MWTISDGHVVVYDPWSNKKGNEENTDSESNEDDEADDTDDTDDESNEDNEDNENDEDEADDTDDDDKVGFRKQASLNRSPRFLAQLCTLPLCKCGLDIYDILCTTHFCELYTV